MADPGNLHPRGGGIAGGEIGLGGSKVSLRPERIIPRFVQPLREYRPFGVRFTSFLASRLVYGTVTIQGIYSDGNQKDALKQMVDGALLKNVRIKLGTDREYLGDLMIESASPDWRAETRDGNIPYTIVGRFSGTIQLSQQSYSISASDSGSWTYFADNDLVDGRKWRVVRGYQDERVDAIVRPFIVNGIDETSVDPDDVIGLVVGQVHPSTQTFKGLSLLRVTCESAGYGVMTGTLEYGLGPWDCSPAAPILSIGFIDDMLTTSAGDIIAPGVNAEVCDSFPVTIVPTMKRRVPLRVYRWPGVWDSEPAPGHPGKINNATYTFPNGTSYPAGEVRWDDVDANPTRADGVTKFSGYVQFSQKDGGWIGGRITCIRSVANELEGNQSLAGYHLESGYENVFQYERVAMTALSDFVPNCYG